MMTTVSNKRFRGSLTRLLEIEKTEFYYSIGRQLSSVYTSRVVVWDFRGFDGEAKLMAHYTARSLELSSRYTVKN